MRAIHQVIAIFPALAHLAWSTIPDGVQQAYRPPSDQATNEQLFCRGNAVVSDGLEDVRSLLLGHIADLSALLAEGLRGRPRVSTVDEFASRFSEPGDHAELFSAPNAGSLLDKTEGSHEANGVENAADGATAFQPNGTAVFQPNGPTPVVQLLPPGWPSLKSPFLKAGSCYCPNCNNPTTTCCQKICVNRSKLRIDEDMEVLQDQKFEDGKQAIRCFCPDCNNPTTTCCEKICVNHSKFRIDEDTDTVVQHQELGQGELQLASDSVSEYEPTGERSFSSVEKQASKTAEADIPIKSQTDSQVNEEKTGNYYQGVVGMVALRTAAGGLLGVESKSDLTSYASFISKALVHELGLDANVQPLRDGDMLPAFVNGAYIEVVGTVAATVESFTRQSLCFRDLFYVIQVSDSSSGHTAPALTFGIDHLQQAGGLALKANLFI